MATMEPETPKLPTEALFFNIEIMGWSPSRPAGRSFRNPVALAAGSTVAALGEVVIELVSRRVPGCQARFLIASSSHGRLNDIGATMAFSCQCADQKSVATGI